MTITAAVPKAVCASTKASKSIRTSSQTLGTKQIQFNYIYSMHILTLEDVKTTGCVANIQQGELTLEE